MIKNAAFSDLYEYLASYLYWVESDVLLTSLFLLLFHKKHLTTTKLKYAKKITTRFLCENN